jgi:hypothetical protein
MIGNSARFAIAPLALLLALLPVRAPAQTSHDDVQKFFQSYFETRLRDSPEFATDTGPYENADRWSDWSKSGRELRRRAKNATTYRRFSRRRSTTLPSASTQ